MRALVFWLCLAWLVLWWQPGVAINDEVVQAAAATAAADGGLVVRGPLPAGYEPFERGLFRHQSLPGDGEVVPPVGSLPLVWAATPLVWLFHALAPHVGLYSMLGAVAGGVLGRSVWMLMDGRLTPWRTQSAWTVAVSTALLAAVRDPGLPGSPWAELAAMQLVGMLAVAGAATLLWDLVRRRSDDRAAHVAAVLLVAATPVAFWAQTVKYHSLSILAVAWVLHALVRGRRRGWLEAGLAAGLGFWNHVPTGLAMAAGVCAVGAVTAWRRRTWAPALVAAGLVPGIAIDLLARARIAAAGVVPKYSGGGGNAADAAAGGIVGRLTTDSILADPSAIPRILWELLIWTHWNRPGAAMAVLTAAPFLVLLVPRWRAAGTLTGFTAVAGAALLFGYAGDILGIGGGVDQRHVLILWPALAAGVALPVARATAAWGWRQWIGWPVLLAAWTGLATGIGILAGEVTHQGVLYEATWPHRYLGLPLAAATLLLALRGSRWVLIAAVWSLALWVHLLATGLNHASPPLSGPHVVAPVDALVRVWGAVGAARW